jgi:hypothetical protein
MDTPHEGFRVAVYRTADDVPADHRFVGYFYWPHGELANVVFRGSDPDALRARIAGFAKAQWDEAAEVRARKEAAAEQRRIAKAKKAAKATGSDQ